jgi:hypothetical protein
MAGVNAHSVVASVADTSSVSAAEVRDLAEMQFVTDPVGLPSEAVSADGDKTVSVRPWTECPVPAVIRSAFIDVLPELRRDGFRGDGLSATNPTAFQGTKPSRRFHPSVCPFWEQVAAHTTGDKGLPSRSGVSAWDRTIQMVGVSLSERLAAYRARNVAVFYRWCHLRIMQILTRKSILSPETMEIIRRYGLAAFMAGGGAAALGGGKPEQ